MKTKPEIPTQGGPTQGPYRVSGGGELGIHIITEEGEIIGRVETAGKHWDEYHSNAKLFSASWSLFEACKEALAESVDASVYPDGSCLPKEVRDRIRAAIQKAEGKA